MNSAVGAREVSVGQGPGVIRAIAGVMSPLAFGGARSALTPKYSEGGV